MRRHRPVALLAAASCMKYDTSLTFPNLLYRLKLRQKEEKYTLKSLTPEYSMYIITNLSSCNETRYAGYM